MSHKKAGGSTNNGRDSKAKRLGVKLFGGQIALPGCIIVRQKGNKYRAGENVRQGKDFTLFAVKAGVVKFTRKNRKRYDGRIYEKVFINVVPAT